MSIREYLEQVQQRANIESVCREQNLTILRLAVMLTAAVEELERIEKIGLGIEARKARLALAATLDALAQETP